MCRTQENLRKNRTFSDRPDRDQTHFKVQSNPLPPIFVLNSDELKPMSDQHVSFFRRQMKICSALVARKSDEHVLIFFPYNTTRYIFKFFHRIATFFKFFLLLSNEFRLGDFKYIGGQSKKRGKRIHFTRLKMR